MTSPELTLDDIARADLGDASRLVTGPFDIGSDRWLAAWALLCRTVMRTNADDEQRRWFPRSCVAATRIGIETARYFGVNVEPLPVWAFAMTRDAYEWHQVNGLGEPSPVGWSVGIGGEGTGEVARRVGRRFYDGHLICRLPGRSRVADISIDQAHRPDKGLLLGRPLVLDVPDDYFSESDPDRLAIFGSEYGGVVAYRRLYGPAARGWKAGDWTPNATMRTAVGEAVRLLREVSR